MTQYLLETIKIQHGHPQFLPYHQQRFNHTRQTLFPHAPPINLAPLLHTAPKQGTHRCRIIYHHQIEHIEYHPHTPRRYNRFKLIIDNDLTYSYKWLQRDRLQQLFELRQHADDILIIQQNKITDTTIANVAFFDGKHWITPQTPLLQGTTRQRLLQEGKLIARDLPVTGITQFSKMAILNALLGFHIIEPFILDPPSSP